jgi:hypothetical protein
MLATTGCALASLLAVAGCTTATSTPPAAAVFLMAGGFITTTMPVPTREIVDIGIGPLRNVTGTAARVLSVSFARAAPEVHTLNVRAYNSNQTGATTLGGLGDLSMECPTTYLPHSVSSYVTPAHSDTPWFIVIAFTISKPGRYYLGRLILRYRTGTREGWQYQNINATVIVKDPPRPGPRPLPASDVCD